MAHLTEPISNYSCIAPWCHFSQGRVFCTRGGGERGERERWNRVLSGSQRPYKWCNKIPVLIRQNKKRNINSEYILCPFRCWEPHFCAVLGRPRWIVPWHTAQILSVESFLPPPMTCCLLFCVINETTDLLLASWNVISLITSISVRHRPVWGTPKDSRTVVSCANIMASQALSTRPKRAGRVCSRSLTPQMQCLLQGFQYNQVAHRCSVLQIFLPRITHT